MRKSQIQEFVDYYGGAGIQHVALATEDVISTVKAMRKRGMEFLDVPQSYYDDLYNRIADIPSLAYVRDNFQEIRDNGILCDFDETGYLL